MCAVKKINMLRSYSTMDKSYIQAQMITAD